MKTTYQFFKNSLIILLLLCIVGFILIFLDSMSLNRMMDIKLSRSRFLNHIAPVIIFPFTIILCSILIQIKATYLKRFRKKDIYSKSLNFYLLFTWWIPLFHFVGSLHSFRALEYDAEQIITKDKLKKLKSGIRWVNTSFIIFFTLTLIAVGFNYLNDNKDSNDFFLNMLYLHLIVALVGFLKINSSLYMDAIHE